MAKETPKKTLVDTVWDFLASVKLAIILFAFIALTSIIGTVLEQGQNYEKNIEVLTKLVGEASAPALYEFFLKLGLMDMYHSSWFIGILITFAVNLTICSLDRLPPIIKLVRDPIKPMQKEFFAGLPFRREMQVKGGPEKSESSAIAAMKKAGFSPLISREPDGVMHLIAESGRWTRLGVFVTHLSILVILAGAVIGALFGFNGGVNIDEGKATVVAYKSGLSFTDAENEEYETIMRAVVVAEGNIDAAAQALGVTGERLRGRMRGLGVEPLGFTVKNNDFEVEYYGASNMAREYKSSLSVFDGREEVIKGQWIEVNAPLKHKGYSFYQSSYGLNQSLPEPKFSVRVLSSTGQAETVLVENEEAFEIPGTGIKVTPLGHAHALGIDQSGRAYNYDEFMYNPAMLVEVAEPGGKTYRQWIMKRNPNSGNLPGGHVIQLADLWGLQYTGLQVRKDPGVWVVYAGCIIMSLGLYVSFFMSHRRVWVRLSPGKGGSSAMVGASANKNRAAFERAMGKMASNIEAGGN